MITFKQTIDVSLIQSVGNDSMICAAAKVSTSGEEARNLVDKEANFGLINYLMKYRHGTPFEHGCMTFFVKAPIFVWREWHRHRIGFSYSEESGRYKELEPVFYMPPRERPMFKVDGWKPGRPKFTEISSVKEDESYDVLCRNLASSYELAYKSYIDNLALGVDPGLARDCLPVGIFSSCWVTCNPRSMMSFLSLRTHRMDAKFVSYPLYEIEVAADKLEKIFSELYPLAYRAFCENGRVGA
jgi:thymidylate synthase (FAD)